MVLDQIKEILKDTMDIDESKITLDAKLKEDLELDSLDSVELIMSAMVCISAFASSGVSIASFTSISQRMQYSSNRALSYSE